MDTHIKLLPKPKPIKKEKKYDENNGGKNKKYKTATHLDELFSKKFIL